MYLVAVKSTQVNMTMLTKSMWLFYSCLHNEYDIIILVWYMYQENLIIIIIILIIIIIIIIIKNNK